MWASGVQNLRTIAKSKYLFDGDDPVLIRNSLWISAPKSSVTLFTPDPAQANTRPKIQIADSGTSPSPQPQDTRSAYVPTTPAACGGTGSSVKICKLESPHFLP